MPGGERGRIAGGDRLVVRLVHHVVGREVAELAASDPDAVRRAPTTTPVGRLDEAAAARRPDLRHVFADDAVADTPGAEPVTDAPTA